MRRLFVFCFLSYVCIYAFEGVVRYGLFLAHADAAILARDLLIDIPIALLLFHQAMRRRVDPAYMLFAGILLVHGTMGYINLHSATAVVYGTKLLVNILFGMLAAPLLVTPDRKMSRVLATVWALSIFGLLIDKAGVLFPWVGLETQIGGINVDVSHDWEITDLFYRRVAGFTRSSISAATIVPFLALVLCFRTRHLVIRAILLSATLGVVFLTTQKGALLSMFLLSCCILSPAVLRLNALRVACLGGAIACIALPILSQGALMEGGGGTFSSATIVMRIMQTWPHAMQWIAWNDNFPFGVGLGGISGAQRFYAPSQYNPADNLFVLMYAFFGVFGIVYLVGLGVMALRTKVSRAIAEPTLSVIGYFLIYGVVLSILEDQVAALAIGAGIGALWQRRYAQDWSLPAVRMQAPRRMQTGLAAPAYAGRRP